MKRAILCLLCALSTTAVVAQVAPTVKQAESACGSLKTKFHVKTGPAQHPLAPAEAGKAQIYVIEDWDSLDTGRVNRPAIRVGLDGKWVGATQGDSYIFFFADPGEHHLCVNWQTDFGSSREVAVYGFEAKPDQTYYFRASLPRGEGIVFSLTFGPINIDEAQLLLAQYPHATSREMK
ncbi:MAG: hypothetical protein ACYCRE_02490 [Acidobacteriaceae bacterium]